MIRIQFLLFLVLTFIAACTDPIEVGSGLLENEILDLQFTDTISLSAKTIKGDSTPTYRNTFDFNTRTHVLGKFEDDYFGSSEGIIYVSASLGFSVPDFVGSRFDSLILILPYDTSGMYGDALGPQEIEVYQMQESFVDIVENQDTLYTSDNFEFMTKLGSKTIFPNYTDSFEIQVPVSDSIITDEVAQHIRIPLDLEGLGDSLTINELYSESDSSFQEFIKGLVIRSNGPTNGLIGVNLGTSEGATLSLYHTDESDPTDIERKRFNFRLGDVRHNELIHDRSGSPAQDAIDNPSGQDYLYLQSMAGTNIAFDISTVTSLQGKLINRAVIEVFLAELPGDDIVQNYPIKNIIPAYYTDNGSLTVTDDILTLGQFSANNLSNIEDFFGGILEEVDVSGTTYQRYSFGVTNHLINYLKAIESGSPISNELVFLTFNKQENVGRSILYSPDFSNPDLAPKLKIVLTNP